MRKHMLNPISVAIILICLFAVSTVMAQESLIFNYQGYLTDSDGNPITGSDIQMTFKIYDDSGLLLWTSGPLTVPVIDGLFTQLLDWADWLPNTEYDPYDGWYLGITIGEDPEMTPRTLLTSAPSAGVSKRVIGDIHTAIGELVVTNPSIYPGLVKLEVSDHYSSVDVFGNIDPFVMAGNLQINSNPDAAGLLMSHGSRDDSLGVELRTSTAANVVRIHPPEPCVPPDPCEPALEMIAEPDKNIIRVHPPDPCVPPEPCGPAFEVISTADSNSIKLYTPGNEGEGGYLSVGTMMSSIELSIYPQAQGAGDVSSGVALGLDSDSSKNYLRLGTTSAEDSGPSVEVYTIATPDNPSGGIVIENPAPEGSDPFGAAITVSESGDILIGAPMDDDPDADGWIELTSDAGASFVEVHSRKPTGGQTAVAMTADDALAQLTLLNGDPTEPSDVVLLTTTDGGGQIGINTDSPEEALDVNGTTKTTGFKMPTGASDGHVLTSDADGNGTWQAPSSGSSKAMCADMYEGMTNASSQVTIPFPVTFTAAPYFSVTGIIKTGAQAGKTAHIPKPTPGNSSVNVTIQYWNGAIFTGVGDSEEVMLSYTAMEK